MMLDSDNIWDEIDTATKAEVNKQELLLDAVITKLKNNFSEKNPDILYALGYSLYMHPRKKNDVQMQIELIKVLSAALNIEPNYVYAKLYLGYFLYDIGEYFGALSIFTVIDKADLDTYQATKVEEILLCCKIKILGLEKCLFEFSVFVEKCLPQPVKFCKKPDFPQTEHNDWTNFYC
ncbi:MAG: hypothetical protein GY749_29820 [Desulfobacteraceae bacterium]|nr:hypothetical protein [Desulfobacteraceae bacterium]